MGWGWLRYAKNRRFVAGFPQSLGFLCLFRAEMETAAKLSFCNGPFGR